MAAQTPSPDQSRIADSVRQRPTIANDSDTAARVDNEPLDPSLKGFLTIPGTETRIRIAGYARVDVIHDFSPIGSTDDFVVATIPTDATTNADNTRIHARQTRINLELRRPVRSRDARIVFENDFFGDSGERAFNLRHAYGQAANVLAGFTVSTLADPDARPDTLDHEGPPARVSARHAQLRYTVGLPARQSLALAIEDAKSDVLREVGDEVVTPRTPWPDVVARYRWDARRGHLQVGSVYRSVGGFVATGTPEAQVFAVGGVVSGSVLFGSDSVVFEATTGKGIARYVKDTSGEGLDAALDNDGRLIAVPVGAALVGYQRVWDARFRSTFAASIVRISNQPMQAATAYHIGRYVATNLLYRRDDALTIGIEVDYGRFTVKDGSNGSAVRLQMAVQYALVK
jgi:DcaP outer membrane protein